MIVSSAGFAASVLALALTAVAATSRAAPPAGNPHRRLGGAQRLQHRRRRDAGADGLPGLARAFFHAGARSLLVSHWRVQSDATERLITSTFKGYRDGAPTKARALQAAMTAMIQDPATANPSLWAPFVIVGEPN